MIIKRSVLPFHVDSFCVKFQKTLSEGFCLIHFPVRLKAHQDGTADETRTRIAPGSHTFTYSGSVSVYSQQCRDRFQLNTARADPTAHNNTLLSTDTDRSESLGSEPSQS